MHVNKEKRKIHFWALLILVEIVLCKWPIFGNRAEVTTFPDKLVCKKNDEQAAM